MGTHKANKMKGRARELREENPERTDQNIADILTKEYGESVARTSVGIWRRADAAEAKAEVPAAPPEAPVTEPQAAEEHHEQVLAAESVVMEEHHEPAVELLEREEATAAALVPAQAPQALGEELDIERAVRLLAECQTVDAAKQIQDRAEAVKVYLREQRAGTELHLRAAEIVVRANRRIGELLLEYRKAGLLAGRGGDRKSKSQSDTLKTADLGIEQNDAMRAERLARVPADKLDSYIAKCREDDKPATKAGALRCAEEPKAKQPAPFDLDRFIRAMLAKVPEEHRAGLPDALRGAAEELEAGKPKPERPGWETEAQAAA